MLYAICAVCGAPEATAKDIRGMHVGHEDVPGLFVYFCGPEHRASDEGRAAVEDLFGEEMDDRRHRHRPRTKKEAAALEARHRARVRYSHG